MHLQCLAYYIYLGANRKFHIYRHRSILKNHYQISWNLQKDNKDFQKILVDASGFKIERTSNFLDALIREKNELKRLNLPLDPRAVQKRSENFLQIFIPKDLLKYISRNPQKVQFYLPENHSFVLDEKEDVIFTEEHINITHEKCLSQSNMQKELWVLSEPKNINSTANITQPLYLNTHILDI